MTRRNISMVALLVSGATGAVAQSSTSTNAPPPPRPMAIATMPSMAAADMQTVLDAHAALGPKPIETLPPARARLQPSAADATKAVMRMKGMPTAPDAAVTTKDVAYGDDPMPFARVYTPAAGGTAPLPVIVYYHGGGWVIADVNTYDAAPRLFSKQLNAIIVSVEYYRFGRISACTRGEVSSPA